LPNTIYFRLDGASGPSVSSLSVQVGGERESHRGTNWLSRFARDDGGLLEHVDHERQDGSRLLLRGPRVPDEPVVLVPLAHVRAHQRKAGEHCGVDVLAAVRVEQVIGDQQPSARFLEPTRFQQPLAFERSREGNPTVTRH